MADARGEARSAAPTHNAAPAPPPAVHLTLHTQTDRQTYTDTQASTILMAKGHNY